MAADSGSIKPRDGQTSRSLGKPVGNSARNALGTPYSLPGNQSRIPLGTPHKVESSTLSRFPFEKPVELPSQLDCADATDASCGNSPDGSGILFRRCWHRRSGAGRRGIATRPGAFRRTVTSVLGPESGRGFHRIRIDRRLVGLVLLLPGRQGKAQAAQEVTPRFLKKSSTPPCRESPLLSRTRYVIARETNSTSSQSRLGGLM